jgi:hypothetical protein
VDAAHTEGSPKKNLDSDEHFDRAFSFMAVKSNHETNCTDDEHHFKTHTEIKTCQQQAGINKKHDNSTIKEFG